MAGGNKNRDDDWDDNDRAGMSDYGDEAGMSTDDMGYDDYEM